MPGAGSAAGPRASWLRRRRRRIKSAQGQWLSAASGEYRASWRGESPGAGGGSCFGGDAPGPSAVEGLPGPSTPRRWGWTLSCQQVGGNHLPGGLQQAWLSGPSQALGVWALRGGGARPASSFGKGCWGGGGGDGVPSSITTKDLAVPGPSQWGVSCMKGSPAVANGGGARGPQFDQWGGRDLGADRSLLFPG